MTSKLHTNITSCQAVCKTLELFSGAFGNSAFKNPSASQVTKGDPAKLVSKTGRAKLLAKIDRAKLVAKIGRAKLGLGFRGLGV